MPIWFLCPLPVEWWGFSTLWDRTQSSPALCHSKECFLWVLLVWMPPEAVSSFPCLDQYQVEDIRQVSRAQSPSLSEQMSPCLSPTNCSRLDISRCIMLPFQLSEAAGLVSTLLPCTWPAPSGGPQSVLCCRSLRIWWPLLSVSYPAFYYFQERE